METIRKTITLTDKQDQWMKTQIAAGEFINDSEYFHDLVRRDQEQNAYYGFEIDHSGRIGWCRKQ
ncbi:MAG: hypothetical protein ABL863_12760 [Nitrosomonas sp.]